MKVGIWGSEVAALLANLARDDGSGRPGEPGSVAGVLGYLRDASVCADGELSFDDVASFRTWFDGRPENQARIGLVEVFSGTRHDLTGVRGGDIVLLAPVDGPPVIGVAGDDGRLYNRGPFDVGPGGSAEVRVYRYLGSPRA